ncbi:MAG TPA: YitT family protein [Candidatus Alectryocaccomicrobium excrementavium]|uniref:YitT family protein n=1 Tax=Candidatus Alectryocaccomicrobium excrementavium TaxID=2840668 RepID=A0A9D1G2L5_9FIRM|nr:YitT family protein [Candidatus Alectryocaccomicrobium excrementavium]
MKKIAGTVWWNWMLIVVGLLASASAYRLFLVPCDIAAGGFTGVGQLVSHITGGAVSVGIVPVILNVPLFAVTVRSLGWRVGARSFVAMLALSFFIDWLPIPAATDDMLLASVFGGLLGGLGFGLILRGGASTGGSDLLGKLIHEKFPYIRVGALVCLIDGLVILGSLFIFDTKNALYALISVGIMNYMLDFALEGPDSARAYFIVTNHSEEIARQLLSEIERGVTGLYAKGMYSGMDKTMLLCVVNRMESVRLRQIVHSVDKNAFVIATNVHEALGEGFKELG